tara:strand:+ start:14122 stop:14373 length:252 start_codon:yes stop_codon:yes gene_type:complete
MKSIEKDLAKAVKTAKETKLELLKQQLAAIAQSGLTRVWTDDVAEVALIQQLAGRFVAEVGETARRPFGVQKPKHYIEFDWSA